MRRSLTAYATSILLLVCGPARAQQDNPVLVYCDDGDIGAGPGSCAALVQALQNELTDFYLDVVHIGELVEPPKGKAHVSPQVRTRTSEAGAVFSIWFSRSGFSPGNLITLHVYDPGIDQTISRTVPALDNLGNLNHADVAFHTRIIMGASLYSDIDAIQDDANLVALAIPEERIEFFESRKPERRAWVRFDAGYLFSGYPTETHWYHGLALDAAFLPIPRLEVFVDLGLSFMQDDVIARNPVWARLDNHQVHVGIGARYDIIGHDRVGLLPTAGFHVGVSRATVSLADRELHYKSIHPAVWAGLEARVHIVKHVSFAVGLGFENLFRYEAVTLIPEEGDNVTIFRLSQFRFSARAAVCVSI